MDETKKTLANPCVCMHVTSMNFDILKTSVLFDCEGRATICYSSRGEAYLFIIIIVIVFFFIHFFGCPYKHYYNKHVCFLLLLLLYGPMR